jgi:alkanesulfonate monooxygenase SsuD/methylene tetrahydromethanopterin reductase-like flavin-dependent oxidoreductase (luciferase family)
MAIRISAELSHICPLEEIRTHATALETFGFYRVWVPDTIVSQWEAWLAASVIMHTTARLKIGLGVMNPYTRHPVVVAQMAATMQRLSGGRLSLSIGSGIERFLNKAGVERHDTAVEECVTLLRELMTGRRTSFSGKAYRIDGMRLRTHPPEKTVPIFQAAVGPAGWESAVKNADGVATLWNDAIGETRRKWMARKVLPTVVLIPFAQARTDFFSRPVNSVDELQARVVSLESDGFDEVMVAYAEMTDLEAAGRVLIEGRKHGGL